MTTAILRTAFLQELRDAFASFEPYFLKSNMEELQDDVAAGKIEKADNAVNQAVRTSEEWFHPANLSQYKAKYYERNTGYQVVRRLVLHEKLLDLQQAWDKLVHEDGRTIQQTEDMVKRLILATSTTFCRFFDPWVGTCSQPTEGDPYCPQHKQKTCHTCGAQAVQACGQTVRGLLCGNGLCGAHPCVHVGNTLSL
jgi:hypothetical protein